MTTNKNVALLMMGLVAVASVGSAFAVLSTSQQPTSSIQTGKGALGMLGHVTLTVYGPDGAIKAYRQTDNLVVGAGANATANKLFGTTLKTHGTLTTSGTFTYIGVGTSNTAVGVQQTDLSAVASSHRLATSVTNSTTQHGQAIISVTFPANRLTNSSAVNIQESALFDNGANGTATTTMFARQTFSSISVNPADTLAVTWTVSVA